MLILTRRIGESVMIGDDVSITVLAVQGSQVRVGIDAPRHIAVHREEIYQRVQAAKERDADLTPATNGAFSSSTIHR